MPAVTRPPLPKLGVPEIDAQHEQVERLVRALEAAVSSNQPPEVHATLLERLEQLTAAHFSTEERFMQSVHFPHLAEHKGLHELLTRQLRDLRTRQAAGRGALTPDALSFLNRWLVDHVWNVDRKIAQYLVEQSRLPRA